MPWFAAGPGKVSDSGGSPRRRELDPALLAEIRTLHFHVKKLADQGISGSYRSAFRGRGIEFEEVREYLPGMDIRSIDWKVTARSGTPYVKSYREERELTVMIAVDVSASTITGTRCQLRDTLLAKAGAVLTLIALANNDKVGLVTYSDSLETYHPPRKARSSVWRILHEVLTPGLYRRGTDLAGLCFFLNKVLKRKSIIFILSDFASPSSDFEHQLAVLTKRHDVTALWARDPVEFELPPRGLFRLRDPETGSETVVDCSNAAVRRKFSELMQNHEQSIRSAFRRRGVGVIELRTDQPFVYEMRRFFQGRTVPHGTGQRREQQAADGS